MKKFRIVFCVLLSFLFSFGLVSCSLDGRDMDGLDKRIEEVRAEIARQEELLEGQLGTLEYYKTESELQALYDKLLELEGKK